MAKTETSNQELSIVPHGRLRSTGRDIALESVIELTTLQVSRGEPMTESARRKTRNRPTKRVRELSDRTPLNPETRGDGGIIAASVLEATPDGQKSQRLAERALLNEGFQVDPEIQRDLVAAMAEIAFDGENYDARRRNQAALTLGMFQKMRLAELEKREELRLREMAIGRGDLALMTVNNNHVDFRAAAIKLQQDPAYIDWLNQQAIDAARLTAGDDESQN